MPMLTFEKYLRRRSQALEACREIYFGPYILQLSTLAVQERTFFVGTRPPGTGLQERRLVIKKKYLINRAGSSDSSDLFYFENIAARKSSTVYWPGPAGSAVGTGRTAPRWVRWSLARLVAACGRDLPDPRPSQDCVLHTVWLGPWGFLGRQTGSTGQCVYRRGQIA